MCVCVGGGGQYISVMIREVYDLMTRAPKHRQNIL